MKTLTQNDFSKFENIPTTKFEKSNFRSAFYFLSKEKRNAILNIYAFFSYLDEIVDNPAIPANLTAKNFTQMKKERLNWWKNQIDFLYSSDYSENQLFPLRQTIEKFQIPQEYFHLLVDGIGVDLEKNFYSDVDELLSYCYGVASVVGLICVHIFVDSPSQINENVRQYAINLGYALQLTNIMRDVYFDARRGYFYLPQEDLLRFNFSEQDILACRYDANFISLMEFQYERTVNYYLLAEKFLANENKKQFQSAEAMKKIYFNLLQKLRQKKFNIFSQKISLSTFEKIRAIF